MTAAEHMMHRLNPRAMIGAEGGVMVMLEDISDPDGRMYRLEYHATSDARHAIAFCLYNPWGGPGNPNAGEQYEEGHVASDGFLCLGAVSERDIKRSPYGLEYAVKRGRYWCTAFSVLKETREFPDP